MASSNNPRKFSEKIALHNQKQAEETAAFEEVMKDLNITRAARVRTMTRLRTFLYIAVSPLLQLQTGGCGDNYKAWDDRVAEVIIKNVCQCVSGSNSVGAL